MIRQPTFVHSSLITLVFPVLLLPSVTLVKTTNALQLELAQELILLVLSQVLQRRHPLQISGVRTARFRQTMLQLQAAHIRMEFAGHQAQPLAAQD